MKNERWHEASNHEDLMATAGRRSWATNADYEDLKATAEKKFTGNKKAIQS